MRPLDQLAEIAQKAVRIGNDLVRSSRPETITEKTDRDTFTDVDIHIERALRSYLAEATPEIGFIGEEEGPSNYASDNGPTWVLDPIDGTANFTHGIPLCAVQIALLHKREAIVASITLPHLQESYVAIKGRGAYVNGAKISRDYKSCDNIARSIVAIGDYATGTDARSKNNLRIALTEVLAERAERVRMFGSAALDLSWTAQGRVDASIILSNNVIDIAAGALIASESGLDLHTSSGDRYNLDSPDIIACSPGLTQSLLQCLEDARSRSQH